VLFFHAGFLAEGLALVQDPQRLLGKRGIFPSGSGTAMSRSASRLRIRIPSTPAPASRSRWIRAAMARSRGE
jgi:hypothetical protein